MRADEKNFEFFHLKRYVLRKAALDGFSCKKTHLEQNNLYKKLTSSGQLTFLRRAYGLIPYS